MDIYLSVNNREQILKLPVLPAEFTVSKPHANEVFETVTQGQLKLIGRPSLKSISWSSFFPVRDYPFLRDRSDTAFGYLYTIDTWMLQKLPIRLIITQMILSIIVGTFSSNIHTLMRLYLTSRSIAVS